MRELKTVLDWSAYPGAGGGFQGAVEMCNNNGACRKLEGGVMCPSYRATRNEKDVTRGRANTLRLAISGQLGPDALASDEMMDTLKLCVSCKACRHECPTGVDMAKMKIEVLAARADKHGLSLRDRLVGYLPRYAGSRLPLRPLVNLRNRSPLLRKLFERFAGISARRALPAFRSDVFVPPADSVGPKSGREVVLFADTFNRIYERENLDAALRVLAAGGYRVHLPKPASGKRPSVLRTHLPLRRSRRRGQAELDRLVAAFAPFAARGVPIVGLEPSCLLTLRDELASLRKDDDAKAVGAHALTFEEFLVREAEAGRLQLRLAPLADKALVHGHCHQKSFGAFTPVQKALQPHPRARRRNRQLILLRHGRCVRLWRGYLRRLDRDGRAVAAARRAPRGQGYADRRRRHVLPPSNPRWRATRSPSRRARAGNEPRSRQSQFTPLTAA